MRPMAKALAFAAGLAAVCLTGCSPFGGGNFTCDGDSSKCRPGGTCQPNNFCTFADGTCDSGQRYEDRSGANSGVCVGDEPIDAGIDTPVGAPCYGVGLVKPCFPSAPMGDVMLPATIDTDAPGTCSTVVTAADDLCVIAGATISNEGAVSVTGSKPLVLVAVTTITIGATLDAASHRAPAKSGPGSDPNGQCTGGTQPTISGGGAGGTLIGAGGNGGNGAAGGTGGIAAAARNVTTLRGGCRGQNAPGVGAQGGAGGGAVYLIANTSITINAPINASGAGGSPGITGSAGAGGGGSGGMIGLDSPVISNNRVVFANGASGGEGSGQATPGNPGPEPIDGVISGPAQDGTTNGGDGGSGSGGTTANGSNGVTGAAGGGAGGGGVGLIKTYRGPLGGMASPPPTL